MPQIVSAHDPGRRVAPSTRRTRWTECAKKRRALFPPPPRTGQRIACTQPARYPIRGIYVAPVRMRAAAIPDKAVNL